MRLPRNRPSYTSEKATGIALPKRIITFARETGKMKYPSFYILILSIFLFSDCKKPENKGSLFPRKEVNVNGTYDLRQMQEAGEILIGTLSGPDSYYDLNGEPMGLQYALIRNFADKHGLGIRMEVAHTEAELIDMLLSGDIDLAAYPLSTDSLRHHGLQPTGVRNTKEKKAWGADKKKAELCRELDQWYHPELLANIQKAEKVREEAPTKVRRSVRPAFISRERGVFSTYDELFKKNARSTGLDWRLLAAVCHVESGFDPKAESGAGARGLMQLMPSTARSLGVTDVFSPEQNIEGGARLLQRLLSHFKDIGEGAERTKFALASYNGGEGHIRDARALTRKYGKNPNKWEEVRPFVLKLSQPTYYRDPVVRYGYMVGQETAAYVSRVAERYSDYGGSLGTTVGVAMPAMPSPQSPATGNGRKNNKFTQGTEIKSADDPSFHSFGE